MSIKNLMIKGVESQYTQKYIANVFRSQNIAKVSKITLIPYTINSEIYSIAYIKIDEWCDSEAAYNLIMRLVNGTREARIVHYDDDWWPLQLNTHNNGELDVGPYTVSFSSLEPEELNSESDDEELFTTSEDGEEEEENQEDVYDYMTGIKKIKGLLNDYYTITEALAYLWQLYQEYQVAPDFRVKDRKKTVVEIAHFENELDKHGLLFGPESDVFMLINHEAIL